MGVVSLWALEYNGQPFRAIFPKAEHEIVWEHISSPVRFRKVAAGLHSAWAIGKTDFQPYLYVNASEVPIRVTEEIYENQRWVPVFGFTGKLLPTDRSAWSFEDGSGYLPKNQFLLPSSGWVWEHPFVIWNNHLQNDKQGWQYAVNFPAKFHASPFSTACVRRRKWIRTRRYIAIESWNRLKMPTAYPIMDITVGGADLPGQSDGYQSVWALTSSGNALYRVNVNNKNPEGAYWLLIESPEDIEFNQLSCCAVTGNLLATTWEGRLFTRQGVCKLNPEGKSWEELERPPNERVINVALGENVAWIVTMDGKVWYANLKQKAERSLTIGSGSDWVEMGVEMNSLSISWNNQVFGISIEDNDIYCRSDVSASELGGRGWLKVSLEFKMIALTSAKPTLVMSDENGENEMKERSNFLKDTFKKHIYGMVNKLDSLCQQGKMLLQLDSLKPSASADNLASTNNRRLSSATAEHDRSSERSVSPSLSFRDLEGKDLLIYENDILTNGGFSPSLCDDLTFNLDSRVRSEEVVLRDKECVDGFRASCGSEHENHAPGAPVSSSDPAQQTMDEVSESSESIAVIGEEDIAAFANDNSPNRRTLQQCSGWLQVSSSACAGITSDTIQTVFGFGGSRILLQLKGKWNRDDFLSDWRQLILCALKSRKSEIDRIVCDAENIEFAIDASKWVKTVHGRFFKSEKDKWIDVTFELESMEQNKVGKLSIYPHKTQFVTSEIQMADITCVMPVIDSGYFACHLYSQHTIELRGDPLRLAFLSEDDRNSWLAFLELELGKSNFPSSLSSIFSVQRFHSRTSAGSVWALSDAGLVFRSSPLTSDLASVPIGQLKWTSIPGHFASVDAGACNVVWAISSDGMPWSFSFGVAASSACQTDAVVEDVYENQRWSTLRGFLTFGGTIGGLYHAWSDAAGTVKRSKDSVRLPSSFWHWASEWTIDFSESIDDEGWLYAKSFRHAFTTKSRRARLRRRRWTRKAIFRYPNAPWISVDAPKLRVISVQKDFSIYCSNGPASCSDLSFAYSQQLPLFVWAVSVSGEVLCRLDVTVEKPDGAAWQHIITPCAMVDVSAGAFYRIWAIGVDGLAYLRYSANVSDLVSCDWTPVSPPSGQKLVAVAAGARIVWALDAEHRLYWRSGISSRTPQGDAWQFLYSDVCHISATSLDELWVVMNYADPAVGKVPNVISRRISICADVPEGTGWDYGIGGCWKSVSAGSLCAPTTA